jgi:hypothetical protein
MGSFTYAIPVPGTDMNSIADPEIATALNTLLTWGNGNIDTNNLSSAAGITFAQLAAGAGQLKPAVATGTTTAGVGRLYVVPSGAPFTITLPTATAGATVGVIAQANVAGTAQVTIAGTGGALIYGVGTIGAGGAASILLGTLGAGVILQADGTNWFIIGGQQDTGWVSLVLGTNIIAAAGHYVPSARLQGDTVRLKGAMTNTAPTSANTLWATVPAGLRPSSVISFAPSDATAVGTWSTPIAASGQMIMVPSAFSGLVLPLDSATYTLT